MATSQKFDINWLPKSARELYGPLLPSMIATQGAKKANDFFWGKFGKYAPYDRPGTTTTTNPDEPLRARREFTVDAMNERMAASRAEAQTAADAERQAAIDEWATTENSILRGGGGLSGESDALTGLGVKGRIDAIINPLKQSYGALSAAYAARESDVLGRFDTAAGELDTALANRRDAALADLEGYGSATKSEIRAAYADTASGAASRLANMGLGSTSAGITTAAGIDRERLNSLNKFGEDLTSSRINLRAGLEADRINAAQWAAGNRANLASTLSSERMGAEDRIAGNLATTRGMLSGDVLNYEAAQTAQEFADEQLRLSQANFETQRYDNYIAMMYNIMRGYQVSEPGYADVFSNLTAAYGVQNAAKQADYRPPSNWFRDGGAALIGAGIQTAGGMYGANTMANAYMSRPLPSGGGYPDPYSGGTRGSF